MPAAIRSVTPPAHLVDALVLANRILAHHGIVDGLGHVSARHPEHADVYLLSVNRAPALVRRADIACWSLDSEPLLPGTGRPYLERFLHGEIYRSRPDVMAIAHSHSPAVIPLGATGNRLRPIFHMAGFLGEGCALFDIRERAGDTDLLIRDPQLGRSLAECLGRGSCVLMRGHGSTTVAGSVEQVVYRAIYAEQNAKMQIQAMQLGEVMYLTDGEASRGAASNDTQIPRSWDLWARQVGPID